MRELNWTNWTRKRHLHFTSTILRGAAIVSPWQITSHPSVPRGPIAPASSVNITPFGNCTSTYTTETTAHDVSSQLQSMMVASSALHSPLAPLCTNFSPAPVLFNFSAPSCDLRRGWSSILTPSPSCSQLFDELCHNASVQYQWFLGGLHPAIHWVHVFLNWLQSANSWVVLGCYLVPCHSFFGELTPAICWTWLGSPLSKQQLFWRYIFWSHSTHGSPYSDDTLSWVSLPFLSLTSIAPWRVTS